MKAKWTWLVTLALFAGGLGLILVLRSDGDETPVTPKLQKPDA